MQDYNDNTSFPQSIEELERAFRDIEYLRKTFDEWQWRWRLLTMPIVQHIISTQSPLTLECTEPLMSKENCDIITKAINEKHIKLLFGKHQIDVYDHVYNNVRSVEQIKQILLER